MLFDNTRQKKSACISMPLFRPFIGYRKIFEILLKCKIIVCCGKFDVSNFPTFIDTSTLSKTIKPCLAIKINDKWQIAGCNYRLILYKSL